MKWMMPRSPSAIVAGGLCTGCGLCEALDSSGTCKMKIDTQGFLRPHGVESIAQADQQKIMNACPGVHVHPIHQDRASSHPRHPQWGDINQCLVGWSSDEVLRKQGASGGALSAICQFLIESKEVNFIIQIGADNRRPLRNVIHTSRSVEQIKHNAGSRYAPSAPLSTISELLDRGERFGVVGKPCDIAGLRNLAKHDHRVDQCIPYMLSFFCAGLPSYLGTSRLLARMEAVEHDVTSFRYRGNGWPGFASAEQVDGTVKQMSYDESWGQVLNRHLQYRCKICPDGVGSLADIACADAWYQDEHGNPCFNEREGRSLILSRNEKGNSILNEMMSQGYLIASSFDSEQIAPIQSHQARRKALAWSRILAMKTLFRRVPDFSGMALLANCHSVSFIQLFKSYVGCLLRLTRMSR